MSGLYSCDFDSDYDFGMLERIEVSDGTAVCCESGIVIPKGQPVAVCWIYCSDENHCEGSFYEQSHADQISLLEKHGKRHYQAIEVWRLLRANNRRYGACAAFGNAVDAYWQAIEDADEGRGTHVLRYKQLGSTIKRASERYAAGRGPRLHPSEAESLRNQDWREQLPFTVRSG